MGILGPNGAGKSTLINVVTGAMRHDQGSLSLDGADVTAMDMTARARLGLLRTFQNVRPSEELTVYQLLRLASSAPSRVANALFDLDSIVELCGLEPYLDRTLDVLPYGIQKAANLAATALCRPRVLLLDEPFAGVSDTEIQRLSQIILTFRKADVAIGLIEHNIGSVMTLCDRIMVLDSGSIIFVGRPNQATVDPTVQLAYLGRRYAMTTDV
jgi:ABC-type branched-subunit amino acid transport system ATPase component